MSLSLSLSVCLSLSLYIYIRLLPICLRVYLSICLSIYVSMCVFMLDIYIYIYICNIYINTYMYTVPVRTLQRGQDITLHSSPLHCMNYPTQDTCVMYTYCPILIFFWHFAEKTWNYKALHRTNACWMSRNSRDKVCVRTNMAPAASMRSFHELHGLTGIFSIPKVNVQSLNTSKHVDKYIEPDQTNWTEMGTGLFIMLRHPKWGISPTIRVDDE